MTYEETPLPNSQPARRSKAVKKEKAIPTVSTPELNLKDAIVAHKKRIEQLKNDIKIEKLRIKQAKLEYKITKGTR